MKAESFLKRLICLGLCALLLLCPALAGAESSAGTAAVTPVSFPNGVLVPSDARSVDLTRLRAGQAEAAIRALKTMTGPEIIELGEERADGPGWEQIARIREAAPGATLHYRFTFCGVEADLADEELDLSYHEIIDGGAELRQILACMPSLRRLVMDSCGLDNEQMASLREDFPSVEIVWRIWFGWVYTVRTDTQKVLASKTSWGGEMFSWNVDVLRYCTKMRYLGLGHNNNITDISFISCMPDLEVCILAMNDVTDLSPLADCPELEYLELFHNYHLQHLAPLAGLTKPRHLNASNCWELEDTTPLYGLDLERLYIGALTKVPREQIETYRRLHPDCEVEDTLYEGSEATWRYTDMSCEELVPRYALLREQFGYDDLAYSVFWLDPYYHET